MVPKYRAYVKKLNKIYRVSMITWSEGETLEGASVCPRNDAPCFLLPNEIELMQWTGLVDCEGNQIFQDDILEETRTGDLCLVKRDFYSLHEISKYAHRCLKVVGSIHTHPELLEGAGCE